MVSRNVGLVDILEVTVSKLKPDTVYRVFLEGRSDPVAVLRTNPAGMGAVSAIGPTREIRPRTNAQAGESTRVSVIEGVAVPVSGPAALGRRLTRRAWTLFAHGDSPRGSALLRRGQSTNAPRMRERLPFRNGSGAVWLPQVSLAAPTSGDSAPRRLAQDIGAPPPGYPVRQFIGDLSGNVGKGKPDPVRTGCTRPRRIWEAVQGKKSKPKLPE